MNADYLAYQQLLESRRQNDLKEQEIAEKKRASIAETNARDADRIARYGVDAVGAGRFDPETGVWHKFGNDKQLANSQLAESQTIRYARDVLRDLALSLVNKIRR